MSSRITESQVTRALLQQVKRNRGSVNRFSEEVSSGFKVRAPGENEYAGSVSQFNQILGRIEGYNTRIASATSMLNFQGDILSQVNDLMARAKEVATQGANETNSASSRAHLSEEVAQIRNQLVSLGNSTYQGKYIYGGADDDDPPFDPATYTTPAAGESSVRYVFDNETGTNITRSVQITDDVSVRVNSSANQVFGGALEALDRLTRSLAGYETLPPSGTPDGTGNAYTFPADYDRQTQDIKGALDMLDTARTQQLVPEQVSIGARINRLETATSLLDAGKISAQQVLDKIQNADVVESASNLTVAQTAFEASLQVTLRAMNLTILDYI